MTIERKIIQDSLRQVLVEEYLASALDKVGYSHTHIQKTPLGEKIVIHASRPGLIVGSKGTNVKKLTKALKTKFAFENPQIEIEEIKDTRLDPKLVAEQIASSLERFGMGRFKAEGYKAMESSIQAGALGVEILISGKIPSARAKRWRFYKGYIKKCGDVAFSGVLTAYCVAKLKSGVVGIQVRIMPPDLVLPDKIILNRDLVVEESQETIEVADGEKQAVESEEKKAEEKTEDKSDKKKKTTKKASSKKETKAPKKSKAKTEAKSEKTDAQVKAETKTE